MHKKKNLLNLRIAKLQEPKIQTMKRPICDGNVQYENILLKNTRAKYKSRFIYCRVERSPVP